MQIRTTHKTMVFRRPFLMRYFDQTLPAGTYEVVTEEEQLEGLSFLASRRLQTYIYRRSPSPKSGSVSTTYVVDPDDLAAAFIRDEHEDEVLEVVDATAKHATKELSAEVHRAAGDGMLEGPKP